ncbi:hypothetical protein ACFW6Q_05300 [Streptomyces sp. NPDC058737]|uniref:hypothetical protein n=1 Tax=Streptomyces sp. NPDC058737 TaxID=3346617 RepID=UPI0036A52B0B
MAGAGGDYTGPIARAVGDLDLSLPAGMVVASLLYAVLARGGRRWAATPSG